MVTKFLSIGMENSKYAGSCPGAGLDAKRMYNLISPRCAYSKLLLNSDATKFSVITAMKEVCKNSDLAIIFYAGHGGSERLKKTAPEEFDGKDEMIFLNDTFMVDDEIWEIISKAKGRVFLMFDCCHSETMFRIKSPSEYLRGKLDFSRVYEEPIDMLCWSGCADNKTSQGWIDGGVFTNTIIKYFDVNKTYDEIWDEISSDEKLAKREIVKRTILRENSAFKTLQFLS